MRTRQRRQEEQSEIPFGRQDGPTLKRIVDHYLNTYLRSRSQARAKGTIATQKSALAPLLAVLPAYPTPGQVQRALQARIDAGEIGETTANKARSYLSHAYEHARNEWPTVAVRNPCKGFPPWKPPQKVPRAMRDPATTFPLLLERACLDAGERSFLCACTLLGLRKSEARGARVAEDLSPDLRTLTVRVQRPAGQAEVKQPKTASSFATFELPELLRVHLREWLRFRAEVREGRAAADRQTRLDAASPFLWPYGSARLAGLMERIRQVAPEDFPRRVQGRGGVAFHGFRDSLGALLYQQGATLAEGQRAMRHQHPSSTAGYFSQWHGAETNTPKLKEVQALLAAPPEVPAGPTLRIVR